MQTFNKINLHHKKHRKETLNIDKNRLQESRNELEVKDV